MTADDGNHQQQADLLNEVLSLNAQEYKKSPLDIRCAFPQ